ncbi:MAG: hypothetical protein DRP87_10850 [Spirochaetes bacterium]|nr:MAG: hypothetical protein DRP87_10850 [Spirochaetota bacterium]
MERDPSTNNPDEDFREKKDFIEFKRRITRLAEDLLELRPHKQDSLSSREEGVEINLQSSRVEVIINVNDLPFLAVTEITGQFKKMFSNHYETPLLVNTSVNVISFEKSVRDGWTSIKYPDSAERIDIEFYFRYPSQWSITIKSSLSNFNDHFEVFVTDTVKKLFPPKTEKSFDTSRYDEAANKYSAVKQISERGEWYREHGSWLESLGCSVFRPGELTWGDLPGLEEISERLKRNIFTPLEREALYTEIAAQILPHGMSVLPRGVLLVGPPGCGKTYSMKVIGSEASLPVVVFSINAVMTKWYGDSENHLAELFHRAKKAGRMILFIDELDALGKKRSESFETTARLVSILLTEMDGIYSTGDILIVGSVNEPDLLDRALLDRFDMKIDFPLPGLQQLKRVFRYYARHLSDEDVKEIASCMDGWNFRKVARFSEEVVRRYVSGLDLSEIKSPDFPLPGKDVYLNYINSI